MSVERARDAQFGGEKENFVQGFPEVVLHVEAGETTGQQMLAQHRTNHLHRCETLYIDGLLQELVSLAPPGMFRQALKAHIRMVGLDDL